MILFDRWYVLVSYLGQIVDSKGLGYRFNPNAFEELFDFMR